MVARINTVHSATGVFCMLVTASCAGIAGAPIAPAVLDAPAGPAVPAVAEPYPELANGFDTLVASGFQGVIVFKSGDGPRRVFIHGPADCEGHRLLDRHSRFDMGSITKNLTAAVILKLIEQGRLSAETRFVDLFQGVPGDKADITVTQLLNHTSGLPESLGEDETYVSRAQYLEMTFAAPLQSAPGSKEEYSNVGYSILGAEIEVVTGRRYEDALRELVLIPAGVPGIGYLAGDRGLNACGMRDGRPWGSTRDYFGPDEPSWHLVGNGGLLTTPEELVDWFDAIFQGRVLSAESVAKFDQLIIAKDKRGRSLRVASGSNDIFSALYLGWPSEQAILMIFTSDSRFQKNQVTPVMFPAFNAFLDRTGSAH